MLGPILIAVGLVLCFVAWHLNRGVSFDDGNPATRDPYPVARNKGGAVFALAIGLAALAFGLYILIGGRWG